MRGILFTALVGALGTLCRYAVSNWTHRLLGAEFAHGTLCVNALGCWIMGFATQLGAGAELMPNATRPALTVEFPGAFTTFSAFGYETVRYIEDGAWRLAIIAIAANLLLGLVACWTGMATASALLRRL